MHSQVSPPRRPHVCIRTDRRQDKQVTTAGPTVTDHSVSSHREKGRRETSKKEGFLSSGEQSSGGDGDSIKHVSATLPYWPLR